LSVRGQFVDVGDVGSRKPWNLSLGSFKERRRRFEVDEDNIQVAGICAFHTGPSDAHGLPARTFFASAVTLLWLSGLPERTARAISSSRIAVEI